MKTRWIALLGVLIPLVVSSPAGAVDWQKVKSEAIEATYSDPKDAAAWYRLGEAEENLGNRSKASDAYGKVVELGASNIAVTSLPAVPVPTAADANPPESSSSGSEFCSDYLSCSGCSISACSDGEQSWYKTSSGSTFYCAALGNCTAAAQSVLAACGCIRRATATHGPTALTGGLLPFPGGSAAPFSSADLLVGRAKRTADSCLRKLGVP